MITYNCEISVFKNEIKSLINFSFLAQFLSWNMNFLLQYSSWFKTKHIATMVILSLEIIKKCMVSIFLTVKIKCSVRIVFFSFQIIRNWITWIKSVKKQSFVRSFIFLLNLENKSLFHLMLVLSSLENCLVIINIALSLLQITFRF